MSDSDFGNDSFITQSSFSGPSQPSWELQSLLERGPESWISRKRCQNYLKNIRVCPLTKPVKQACRRYFM